LGRFHIQADNVAGLELGREIADYDGKIIQGYFQGKPPKK